jgi:hypothetical protein
MRSPSVPPRAMGMVWSSCMWRGSVMMPTHLALRLSGQGVPSAWGMSRSRVRLCWYPYGWGMGQLVTAYTVTVVTAE